MVPKLGPEHLAPRQTIIGNGPTFYTAHDPTGEDEYEEVQHFAGKKHGAIVRTVQQSPNQQVAGPDQSNDDCQENAQTPPGTQFAGTVEHPAHYGEVGRGNPLSQCRFSVLVNTMPIAYLFSEPAGKER